MHKALRLTRGISLVTRLTLLLVVVGLLASVQAQQTWISCVPSEIMAFRERIHVRCAASINGITYFAVSTSDAAWSARVMSVLNTAQVAGRTVTLLYDPADLSGASYGCQANDCRVILAVGFGQ